MFFFLPYKAGRFIRIDLHKLGRTKGPQKHGVTMQNQDEQYSLPSIKKHRDMAVAVGADVLSTCIAGLYPAGFAAHTLAIFSLQCRFIGKKEM